MAVLASAVAGRDVTGGWMRDPDAHRIFAVIDALGPPACWQVRLVAGTYAMASAAVAPAVARYAGDPDRVAAAEASLPAAAADLLAAARRAGEVRMDGWPGPAAARQAARRPLDRHLLVVTEEVHAEGSGAHIAVVRPWAAGTLAAAHPDPPGAFDDAVDALVAAGLHSAVVAPIADVRRWFPEAGAGLDRLRARHDAVPVGARHVALAAVAGDEHQRAAGGKRSPD